MADETPTPAAVLTGPPSVEATLAQAKATAERLGIQLTQPFKPLANPSTGSPEQRSLATADRMIANGADRGRVEAALQAEGGDPAQLDQRTPEQRRHDAAHGMPDRVDPASYFFALPPADVIGNQQAFASDVRSLAAGLNLTTDRGNALALTVVRAVRAAAADVDRPGTTARNEQTLRNVYGGQYDAKVASINALLNEAGKSITNRAFVDQLRPSGLLGSQPFVFAALAGRAAGWAAWTARRPK